LSCLPSSYKDRIEFDNPKTLEETMRKAKLCFEQYKNRNENSKNWNGKKVERFDPKKKGGAYSNKMLIRDFREVISLEQVNLSINLKIRVPNHQPSSIKKLPKKRQ
jgi:hypothetical protein